MSINRIDGDVQVAIKLLREGKTLSAAARVLPVTYRALQKAIKKVLGPEEYMLLMRRAGKDQGRKLKPEPTQ